MTGMQFGILALVIILVGLLGLSLWDGETPWGHRAVEPKLYWSAISLLSGMIVGLLCFAFIF
jgi:hypothetical protein